MKHSKTKIKWALGVLTRAKRKLGKKKRKAHKRKRAHARRDPSHRSRSAAARKAARTRARKAAKRRSAARKAAQTRKRHRGGRDPRWYGHKKAHARAARKGWRKRKGAGRRLHKRRHDPELLAPASDPRHWRRHDPEGDPRRYHTLGRRRGAAGPWYVGYRDPE